MNDDSSRSPAKLGWNLAGIDATICSAFLDGQFHSEFVRNAFHALGPSERDTFFAMACYVYGVETAYLSCAERPAEMRGINFTGDPWIWRKFAGGGELVVIEWLNGDPPSIVDFTVPGSNRTMMTEFSTGRSICFRSRS
jgi:hypothetical protein